MSSCKGERSEINNVNHVAAQFLYELLTVLNFNCRLGAAQTPLIGDGVDLVCRPGLLSRLICGGAARTETTKGHANPRVSGFTESSSARFLSWHTLTFSRLCPIGVGGVVPSGRLLGLRVAGSVSVFEHATKRFCKRGCLPSEATAQRWCKGAGSQQGEGLGTTRDCFCYLENTQVTYTKCKFAFGHQLTHY